MKILVSKVQIPLSHLFNCDGTCTPSVFQEPNGLCVICGRKHKIYVPHRVFEGWVMFWLKDRD